MERSCPKATQEEIEMAGDERARWDGLVEALSTRYDGTGPGMMFGRPCLKRNGKMAACLWTDGGIAVKLVDETDRTEALGLDGAGLFDPGMGRVMREWVHVPATSAAGWEALLARSLETLPTG
jgi:hypothetical protein